LAIESVQHVELIFPLSRRNEVLRELHAAEVLHLDEPGEEVIEAGAERVSVSTAEIDDKIAALSAAAELLESYKDLTPKKSLIESFFGVAPPATRADLLEAGNGVDTDSIGELAGRLRDRERQLSKSRSDSESELIALRPFVGLSFTSAQMRVPTRATVLFGQMTPDNFNALRLDPGAGTVACEEARRQKKTVYLLAAFLPANRETALEKLREHGFDEIALPVLECSTEERIGQLHKQIQDFDREREDIREEAAGLAVGYNRIVKAQAFWEDQRELSEAAAKTAATRRSGMITGWVRSREAFKLNRLLSERLDYCSVELREPLPDEEPPVSIKLPALLRPMQMLVNMFGMPTYRSVDATPFLAICFLVFFGCCFGDVVYGLGLCGLSLYVMRKYRYSWVKNFFQFFLYAGISATIFGLLTGTWMGDLLTHEEAIYVSKSNPLVIFANKCTLFNPMTDPLNGLVLALIIGMVTQFYGIIVKMIMEVRRRDYAAAAFDGGLWLLFLPGLTLLVLPMFMPAASSFMGLGIGLSITGAIGLILTQGRHEEGFLSKAITGVVSLYGIMGSYGATAFLSDVLSYSRLLALGLATSILGLSVNMIGGLLRDVHPVIGLILFILFVTVGHIVNFAMSILGAFVHPARLILLEFFGRFYETGGRAFAPLGLRSERVSIVDVRGN
jgi:V/A-type H+/Na+-transporting ATPase subunit I